MSKIKKLINYILHDRSRIKLYLLHKFSRFYSDEKYLNKIYKLNFGKKLDLENPQTFSEKLNWLKLNSRKPEYTIMADKFLVKEYVTNIIGQEYVVPCYGNWERYEDIDFDALPNQFAIKMTHNSSGAFLCKDKTKLDKTKLKRYIDTYFHHNYYWHLREWPYKEIKPRIIAEELLNDNTGEVLRDYKFWCFSGKPTYMYCTVKGTAVYENFYDMDFNPVDINHGFPRHTPEFEKPAQFEKMKALATQLSSNVPFVRIDFYEVNGRVYFGEYTFYDWGGMKPFNDEAQDVALGKLIVL